MAWIFAAIAVIAILGLLIVALSKPNTNRQQEQHQPQLAKQDGPAKPQAAEDAQTQIQCWPQENKQHNYWERFVCYVETRDKFFTAFGTIVIAAFTICLAFATIFLYVATRNLVESADETAQKQLRAYMGIHAMKATVYPFEQGGFAFIAEAELRNFGQTPAYDMVVQCNAKVDVPDAIPFDDSQGNAKSGGATIAFRDAGLRAAQWEQISEADKDAIFRREKVIFLWGTIRYRDAFERRHFFTFRLVSGALVVGSGGVYDMYAHPLGIEAD